MDMDSDKNRTVRYQSLRVGRAIRKPVRIMAAALLLSLVIAAGMMFATPGAAEAGINGQQVAVWSGGGYAFRITGTNQNGKAVQSPWYLLYDGQWTGLYKWWWKGNVTITIEDLTTAGPLYVNHSCYVPQFQVFSDWTYCGPYL